ncbi:MAG: tetratricopeptide repeat protein, partial [Candidatus Baltobacteraceae bacterium]
MNELGIGLRAQGRLSEAIVVFREGIERFPAEVALHQNLAQALYESGDTPQAIAAHKRALILDPKSVASHLALYEFLQITGEREAALEHQREALDGTRLFSHLAAREQRSVLILCAPGDWQANIPVDFLFDRTTTSVHKLYLIDLEGLQRDRLPEYDVIWNAIAESPEAIPYLALAEYILASQ